MSEFTGWTFGGEEWELFDGEEWEIFGGEEWELFGGEEWELTSNNATGWDLRTWASTFVRLKMRLEVTKEASH